MLGLAVTAMHTNKAMTFPKRWRHTKGIALLCGGLATRTLLCNQQLNAVTLFCSKLSRHIVAKAAVCHVTFHGGGCKYNIPSCV